MDLEQFEALSELIDKIRAIDSEIAKLFAYNELSEDKSAKKMYLYCEGGSDKIELSEADKTHVLEELSKRYDEAKKDLYKELDELLKDKV